MHVWIATVTARYSLRPCVAHRFWPSALAPPSGSCIAGCWHGRLSLCRVVRNCVALFRRESAW